MTQRPAIAQHWRPAVGIAVVLALVATLLFIPRGDQNPRVQDLPEDLLGEPDLHMRDALITQFTARGTMKYQLASRRIRHFESDELTRLTAPNLSLYSTSQPPWQVSSDHGYIRQSRAQRPPTEVVFLRENVQLKQEYDDGRHIRLNSPALYLYPDRQYAETDQDVIIETNVGRTKAVGLEGDLQSGLLNLFSSSEQRVHTIVLPNQFK
jgi:lipopolysaccharide export system protein LptC